VPDLLAHPHGRGRGSGVATAPTRGTVEKPLFLSKPCTEAVNALQWRIRHQIRDLIRNPRALRGFSYTRHKRVEYCHAYMFFYCRRGCCGPRVSGPLMRPMVWKLPPRRWGPCRRCYRRRDRRPRRRGGDRLGRLQPILLRAAAASLLRVLIEQHGTGIDRTARPRAGPTPASPPTDEAGILAAGGPRLGAS
jgi:hypothetical protein